MTTSAATDLLLQQARAWQADDPDDITRAELAQGDDVAPIPGTKRVAYLEENVGATDVDLTAEDLTALEDAVPRDAVVGDRYGDMSTVNA